MVAFLQMAFHLITILKSPHNADGSFERAAEVGGQ
jgi:hypothetical protein